MTTPQAPIPAGPEARVSLPTKWIAKTIVVAVFLWLFSYAAMRIVMTVQNSACYPDAVPLTDHEARVCRTATDWSDVSGLIWLLTPFLWGLLGLLVKAIPEWLASIRRIILGALVAVPLTNIAVMLIAFHPYWSLLEWSAIFKA